MGRVRSEGLRAWCPRAPCDHCAPGVNTYADAELGPMGPLRSIMFRHPVLSTPAQSRRCCSSLPTQEMSACSFTCLEVSSSTTMLLSPRPTWNPPLRPHPCYAVPLFSLFSFSALSPYLPPCRTGLGAQAPCFALPLGLGIPWFPPGWERDGPPYGFPVLQPRTNKVVAPAALSKDMPDAMRQALRLCDGLDFLLLGLLRWVSFFCSGPCRITCSEFAWGKAQIGRLDRSFQLKVREAWGKRKKCLTKVRELAATHCQISRGGGPLREEY